MTINNLNLEEACLSSSNSSDPTAAVAAVNAAAANAAAVHAAAQLNPLTPSLAFGCCPSFKTMESMCGCSLLLQSNSDHPTARAAPAASLFLPTPFCWVQLRTLRVSLFLLLLHVRSFLSRLFRSLQIVCPLAFTRFPCRYFNVHILWRARAVHHPSPVELPSPPINLSLSPFPSYIKPPPLSPLASLRLPLSASACPTTLPIQSLQKCPLNGLHTPDCTYKTLLMLSRSS